MDKVIDSEVANVFQSYPEPMRLKLLFIRELIMETAAETECIEAIEETLKWGEPSYLTKNGSTVRVGWKTSRPDEYSVLFNCKTKLIETFKELYPELFRYEGNRAIMFDKDDDIPVNELKHCITLSLTYHRVKHLPMLGA